MKTAHCRIEALPAKTPPFQFRNNLRAIVDAGIPPDTIRFSL